METARPLLIRRDAGSEPEDQALRLLARLLVRCYRGEAATSAAARQADGGADASPSSVPSGKPTGIPPLVSE